MVKLSVNGKLHNVDVEPGTPLLWALRDSIGLKGTKFGCGAGLCGACTVHVDGAAVRSCVFPAEQASGAEITTIEGLDGNGQHPLQRAWVEEQVPQCGYCQSGMIMAAAALLRQNPSPSDEYLNQGITNICRCGTYNRIKKAIRRAAHDKAEGVQSA